MSHLCWNNYLLECQGYNINSTIMYQDNHPDILLRNNGRASSSKRTKHLNISYFFITDRIKKGDLHIEYCPTDNMVANFFTKPLQGKKFLQFRKVIMNLQDWNLPWAKECVGNQPISYYINCPMFGFQSLLYTVWYRIHKGIIWTSTLCIFGVTIWHPFTIWHLFINWHLFKIVTNILTCLFAKMWELLTIILHSISSI